MKRQTRRLIGALFSLWILAAGMSVSAQVPAAKNARPSNLNAQYHRAETAWKSGNSLLEAKARVDQVISALPEDQEALKLRARILLSMDRNEDAYVDARTVASLSPGDAEAYAILCEAARKSGRTEEAKAAMEKVSGLVIDNANLHMQLSREAAMLAQFDRAEAFARTAMVQEPEDPVTHYQMARVFAVQGKYDEARTILERGIQKRILTQSTILSDSVLAPVLTGSINH